MRNNGNRMVSRRKNLPGRVEIFSRLAGEAGEHACPPSGGVPSRLNGTDQKKFIREVRRWTDETAPGKVACGRKT